VEKIVWRLNGFIKVVPGNHDGKWIKGYHKTPGLGDKLEILPPLVSLRLPVQEFRDAHVASVPRYIVVCHYALRVWEAWRRGSWHIYGHSHTNLPPHGLSFDVGVDGHDFRPWSLREVYQKVKGLTPFTVKNEHADDVGEGSV
jgi:calcineurin-like phosphoesterase family protein